MKRCKAVSTTRPEARDFSNLKRRREGVMKRNKLCNLTFKPKLGPLRTVLVYVSLKHHCDTSTGVTFKILAPLSHMRAVCTYVNRQGSKV